MLKYCIQQYKFSNFTAPNEWKKFLTTQETNRIFAADIIFYCTELFFNIEMCVSQETSTFLTPYMKINESTKSKKIPFQ